LGAGLRVGKPTLFDGAPAVGVGAGCFVGVGSFAPGFEMGL